MSVQAGGGVPFEDVLRRFMNAIGQIESTNNYSALGPQTEKYGRAQGRYQIMSEIWPHWAAEAGLGSNASPWDPQNQEAVASFKMRQYYETYRSWELVAIAWFAGPGNANKVAEGGMGAVAGVKDVLGTEVAEYVDKAMQVFRDPSSAQDPMRRVDRPGGSTTADPPGTSPTTGGYVAPDKGTVWSPGTDTSGFGTDTPGGVGSAADTDASGHVDEDELAAHIQRTYPQMLWALNDPELGPILRQAAEESWDKARMYGALVQTNFWKNHPERERILINLRENDPATYQQMLDEQITRVRTIGEQLGWGVLPDGRLRAIAQEAMMNSWSDQRLQEQLIEHMPINIEEIEKGNVGGRVAEIKQNLDAITNDYLIGLSETEKKGWIKRILTGEVDENAFMEHAQQVALGQYAWMADAMERGLTPKQFTDPYRNWIAQTMETSPETIDMTQAQNQDVLYDRAEGRIRTLPEVEEYVKRNFEGWTRTRQANEQYATVNETLLRTFGKVA